MHTHPGAGDRCNGFRRRCFPRVSSARSLLVGLVAILAVTFAMPAMESAAQDALDFTSQIGENAEMAAEDTVEVLADHTGKASLSPHPGVAITMSGGRRRYQGSREALAWEGYETRSSVVLDRDLGHGFVGGLGLTWSSGSVDLGGSADLGGPMPLPFTSTLEYGITSVLPGLGWRWAPGSGLWVILGYVEGELELNHFLSFAPQQGDIKQRATAAGANVRLLSVGAAESGRQMTLTLKGIGVSSRLEASGNDEVLQKQTRDFQRLGLALNGAGAFRLAPGVLRPEVEFGVNRVDIEEEAVTNMRLVGALAYTIPTWDLTVAVTVKTMLAHEKGDRNLYGGITLRFRPRSLFFKLFGDGAD